MLSLSTFFSPTQSRRTLGILMKSAIIGTKKSGRTRWDAWHCSSLSFLGPGYNLDRGDQIELYGVSWVGESVVFMYCAHVEYPVN